MMLHLKIVVIAALMAASAVLHCQAESTTAASTRRFVSNIDNRPSPIAEIFVQRGNQSLPRGEYEFQPVIFALWEDGRVVWSHDLKKGGFPYSEAQLTPERASKVVTALKQENLFRSDLAAASYIIVDASCNIIYVRNGSEFLYMQSSHEHIPANGALPFQRDWDKVKQELLSAIPDTGTSAPQIRFKPERIDAKTGARITVGSSPH